jgi:methylamine--corrinoid protein Co-methyltransferase
MESAIELWNRCEGGEQISETDFDMILLKKAAELKNEYEIQYTPSEIIPTDENLTKNLFDAAVDLLCEVGLQYSGITSTRVTFNEKEIHTALKDASSTVSIGSGEELRDITARKIGEKKAPLIVGGVCGCPVSENIYRDVLYSYAKEEIDGIIGGCLTTYHNLSIKKGTPIEVGAVLHEVRLIREAIKKAQKPGLCIVGPMSGTSAVSLNSGYSPGGMRETDMFNLAPLNELKIDINLLNRLYYIKHNKLILEASQCPMVGYIGGPEETAIVSTAEIILDYLLGATTSGTSPSSIRTSTSTEKGTLWVLASSLLAVKKRFDIIVDNWIWAGGEPCTDMLCYEIAAQTIVDTLCGADMIFSSGATKGAKTDYYTGMEARVAKEVSEVAAKIDIKEANDVLNELINRYEDNLLEGRIPEGKSFTECYSPKEISPSSDYLQIWSEVKSDIANMGLDI